VDYWNHLGWIDPFSSPVFSRRQREYSESLQSEAYTPQMVIDGKAAFVGSDQNRALAAISRDLKEPRVMVSIQPVRGADTSGQNSASFAIKVGEHPRLNLRGKALVFLAITEDDLQSNVRSGENSGRTLAHTGVVRELKTIGTLDVQPDAVFQANAVIKISSTWKRKDLRAVAFLEHQGSHRILGAAETPFPSL
jgi:hypothetical protein